MWFLRQHGRASSYRSYPNPLSFFLSLSFYIKDKRFDNSSKVSSAPVAEAYSFEFLFISASFVGLCILIASLDWSIPVCYIKLLRLSLCSRSSKVWTSHFSSSTCCGYLIMSSSDSLEEYRWLYYWFICFESLDYRYLISAWLCFFSDFEFRFAAIVLLIGACLGLSSLPSNEWLRKSSSD